ncbi:MAG: diacylglycerol kinase family protein [Candidatus Andeanibacterium colombiense]|uniref:Diacylglycerol kinase family protein n=1 Tax=Candidatus Andeanibacterium colombiense TaxID=3121345 RepID=A0AAJ5X6H4_9SPHN|nr:MAG: diacylglycerol kinase family protein [Sphingomonadaceae bacterium]
MSDMRPLWLVTNKASGSNSGTSLEELRDACAAAGLRIAGTSCFPDEDLPTARELDAAGVELVAIYTGDGTVNALVTSLYGWSGAVLILPGGTMNLLYHRLHGERELAEVLAAVAAGGARRCRPDIVRCGDRGDGLSGVMAGPGTQWNDVREAIRKVDLPALAAGTAQAIGSSVASPMIACRDLGRPEGYPLVMLTPEQGGFVVDAYYAETLEEYLAHGLALLKRDFRDGPHDRLGKVAELTIENLAGDPVGLLVDGEPAEAGHSVRFALAPCEVDLLATEP